MSQLPRKPKASPADERETFDIARSQEGGWDSDMFFPPPGTISAREYGCCCAPARLGRGTVENPFFLHVSCPLHGVDAFEEHSKGPRH
jgi:hypothetical protein